jgi:hypothetical protein
MQTQLPHLILPDYTADDHVGALFEELETLETAVLPERVVSKSGTTKQWINLCTCSK